jgi:glycosyltransferase involved in cell wall biosynthesis
MENPFFTVIISSFNRAGLLPKAVNSVLAQTEKNFEILISDDGSQDNTREVGGKFAKEHKNIKYFYHQHMGTGASKNFVLPLAKGKYITFLDDDDEYTPDHLALRKDFLELNPQTQLLHCGKRVVGNEFVPDKYRPGELIHISKVVTGGTFVVKKDVFGTIGGFPEKNFGNDTEFYEKAVAAHLVINKIKTPTYIYNRTKDSITNNI